MIGRIDFPLSSHEPFAAHAIPYTPKNSFDGSKPFVVAPGNTQTEIVAEIDFKETTPFTVCFFDPELLPFKGNINPIQSRISVSCVIEFGGNSGMAGTSVLYLGQGFFRQMIGSYVRAYITVENQAAGTPFTRHLGALISRGSFTPQAQSTPDGGEIVANGATSSRIWFKPFSHSIRVFGTGAFEIQWIDAAGVVVSTYLSAVSDINSNIDSGWIPIPHGFLSGYQVYNSGGLLQKFAFFYQV